MRVASGISQLGINRKSRVLCVMPHPDDEAVFIGGLLHKLSLSKIKVQVITVTEGEASTLRYWVPDHAKLSDIRRSELKQSLSRLGIKDYICWKYPDGGLENKTIKLKNRLKSAINSFRPTHIITLEPDGIYGHPDHITLTNCVKNIVPQRVTLIYSTVRPAFIMPSARRMAQKSDIVPLPPDIELRLSLRNAAAKLQSLMAHKSQLIKPPFPFKNTVFFLKNKMFTHEYYCFAKSS